MSTCSGAKGEVIFSVSKRELVRLVLCMTGGQIATAVFEQVRERSLAAEQRLLV